MSDYHSRHSGPQIDNMLDAINASLVTPGSNSDPTLVGYRYLGRANLSTIPNPTGSKVFYISSTPGTYTRFGNLVVAPGENVIFKKDASGNWTKENLVDLRELENEVFPLEVDFNINVSGIQEYTGTPLSKTLSWSVTRKDAAKVPSSIVIKQDGVTIEEITAPTQAVGTKNVSINKVGVTSFVGTFIADNLTVNMEKNVTQVLPCYIGFYSSGANANTMKGSLIKKLVSSVEELSGTYTNYHTGYNFTILIPDSMSISGITSSGFSVPMNTPVTDSSIVVGGYAQTYKIYRSASETGINSGDMIVDIH